MKTFFHKLAVTPAILTPIMIMVVVFCTYLYTAGSQNTNRDSIKPNSESLKKKQYQPFHSRGPIKNVKENGMPYTGQELVYPACASHTVFSHNQYTLTI